MSEWISVEDSFPGRDMDGVALIVTVKTSSGEFVCETDAWHRYPQHKNGGAFYFWRERVTHWMRLPPPAPQE